MSPAPPARQPDAVERARERAVALGTATDLAMLAAHVTLGVLGGSLTILAEAIRGGLMLSVEAYALVVLHRLHRGRAMPTEFDAGKLEVFCNLLIAFAKIGASAWIAARAAGIILVGQSDASPLAMALAACLGAVGLLVNLQAFRLTHHVTARGRTAIMNSQLISRTVKLRCAFVVSVTLTVGAATADPMVAAWADGVGALFVAWFILIAGFRTTRVCLADLLDQPLDPATRQTLLEAIERHHASFASLGRIRARRSGMVVYVEVTLAYDPALPMAEVDRRNAALRASVAAAVRGADVSIIAAASADPAGGQPDRRGGHALAG